MDNFDQFRFSNPISWNILVKIRHFAPEQISYFSDAACNSFWVSSLTIPSDSYTHFPITARCYLLKKQNNEATKLCLTRAYSSLFFSHCYCCCRFILLGIFVLSLFAIVDRFVWLVDWCNRNSSTPLLLPSQFAIGIKCWRHSHRAIFFFIRLDCVCTEQCAWKCNSMQIDFHHNISIIGLPLHSPYTISYTQPDLFRLLRIVE